jgi:uncharacterized protein YdeI (YjbR/CyaY-like superfamily)
VSIVDKTSIKELSDRLSYTHQKEYMTWIDSAKKAETQQASVGQKINMLVADR